MRLSFDQMHKKGSKLVGIYRGVVESNKDPDKRGRCKVRIFGVHSPEKQEKTVDGIATDNLPWAEPALSLFEGAVSGFGAWTVPLQGSHVYIFFENGNPMQPRFFASSPGKPKEVPSRKEGFSDPEGIYPTGHRLDEPDFHRLGRDEDSNTVVTYKEQHLEESVPTGWSGTWDEPEPGWKQNEKKYPDTAVIATHGGVQIEIESTPNSPRLSVYHPSNTYIEIDKEGNIVIRNDRDRYDIVRKDERKVVRGNQYETVRGDQDELVEGDEKQLIKGNRITTIKGNWYLNVEGEVIGDAYTNWMLTGRIMDIDMKDYVKVEAPTVTISGMTYIN